MISLSVRKKTFARSDRSLEVCFAPTIIYIPKIAVRSTALHFLSAQDFADHKRSNYETDI